MGNGTKLRYFQSSNTKEIEGFVESLPFKIEIKSAYAFGGKHYIAFTMLEKDTLVSDVFPDDADKVPPVQKTRKTRKKKIK